MLQRQAHLLIHTTAALHPCSRIRSDRHTHCKQVNDITGGPACWSACNCLQAPHTKARPTHTSHLRPSLPLTRELVTPHAAAGRQVRPKHAHTHLPGCCFCCAMLHPSSSPVHGIPCTGLGAPTRTEREAATHTSPMCWALLNPAEIHLTTASQLRTVPHTCLTHPTHPPS
jgi:hypothetical protein